MRIISFLSLIAFSLYAAEEVAPQDYNLYMLEAMDDQDWWGVVDYSTLLLDRFEDSPFEQDAVFAQAKAYYHLGLYEHADKEFTAYMNDAAGSTHFFEAVEYKFHIAEAYRSGARKHLFDSHKLPAIVPAEEDALRIYDEVITTLPHHEMAAHSLLQKGCLMADAEDFKPSVEALQQLIRRFPKQGLAADAFLEINRVYLMQCRAEGLDSNLLDLADVNLRRFQQAYPREPRLVEAEKYLTDMQTLFARDLWEVGNFYERTHKPTAAQIYYQRLIEKFPQSEPAALAREKLASITPPAAV